MGFLNLQEKESGAKKKEFKQEKRIAEENERKRSLSRNPDLRKAEKEEENTSRERIRQKLHQDKIERRAELGLPLQSQASLKTAIPMVQENKVVPANSTPKEDNAEQVNDEDELTPQHNANGPTNELVEPNNSDELQGGDASGPSAANPTTNPINERRRRTMKAPTWMQDYVHGEGVVSDK
ncbi:hypothetical protein L1887_41816 [Cichorium endivia]|nr:hypothetical protein L1887_41816 [Cichorium endivia]